MSIVEEGYPNPSILWTAHRIQRISGPIALYAADWLDTTFAISEQSTLNVPIRLSSQHPENCGSDGQVSCSPDELTYFNARETGLDSFRFSRKIVRNLANKPVPRSLLLRALYLALAGYCANPVAKVVPLYSMEIPHESGGLTGTDIVALKVQVQRELEGWASADGAITVRKATAEYGVSMLTQ